jgi:hypothetical protein
MPRFIVEHRLAAIPHRCGADAMSSLWLHSARRAHVAHRERSTQRWNPAWPRPTTRFSPVWQQAAQHCASGLRAEAVLLALNCFPNFPI